MQTESNQNSTESKSNKDDQPYVRYDGFVNVNDIVNRRRQLRNAAFNTAHETWDADLNFTAKEDPEKGAEDTP